MKAKDFLELAQKHAEWMKKTPVKTTIPLEYAVWYQGTMYHPLELTFGFGADAQLITSGVLISRTANSTMRVPLDQIESGRSEKEEGYDGIYLPPDA